MNKMKWKWINDNNDNNVKIKWNNINVIWKMKIMKVIIIMK